MAIYCLCGERNAEIATDDNALIGVWLSRQMECVKTGANQYVKKTPDEGQDPEYRQHYPNVDLFRCKACGAYIAKDG